MPFKLGLMILNPVLDKVLLKIKLSLEKKWFPDKIKLIFKFFLEIRRL